MKKLNIGVDCDEVLLNFHDASVRALKQSLGDWRGDTANLFTFQDCEAYLAARGNKKPTNSLWEYIEKYKTYRDIANIQGAVEFIAWLREQGHEVWAVTAPPRSCPEWCHTRQGQLATRFGIDRKRTYFAADKSMWGGDVLIDDLQSHLDGWQAAQPHRQGWGILHVPKLGFEHTMAELKKRTG